MLELVGPAWLHFALVAMALKLSTSKRQFAFLALIILALPLWAQETNYFTPSPKLKALLASNPGARTALSNACAQAFLGRTVGLYYFYSYTDAVARAYHFYPASPYQADVVVCVRENQEPWDELTCILFELNNSKNEEHFRALSERVNAGAIAKHEFAIAVSRAEFETTKSTRELVRGFHLSRKEKQKSYYYSLFLNCPSDFDGFLSYEKKVSTKRDSIKEYEAQYDALQKSHAGD